LVKALYCIRIFPIKASLCVGLCRYRGLILVLTFLFYTAYHLSRKPISIVKSELHRNCSTVIRPADLNVSDNATWCDWAPFDQDNYQTLFGLLDNCFLVAYAVGMFFSGMFGERLPLRLYLTVGMLLSGLFTCLFGLGFYWNIHSLTYYAIIQVMNGLAQTTGWPAVVACVGNWFGKGKRGLIMGVWNSHTSVGNILGSLIAGAFVSSAWGLSFIVPGAIIAATGLLCFCLLVDSKCLCSGERKGTLQEQLIPSTKQRHLEKLADIQNIDPYELLQRRPGPFTSVHIHGHSKLPSRMLFIYFFSFTFVPARNKIFKSNAPVCFPGRVGVLLLSALAKLVSYTFLYWLPLYISNVGQHVHAVRRGGIVGGIVAGLVSDYTGARAATCWVMLVAAAPMLFLYNSIGQQSLGISIGMLMLCGALVNGPYALITTAVSADLGTHESLRGNSRALSTVTAIIDGTGSVGAALGPLLAGVISPTGWNNVFYMLITADVLACLVSARHKTITGFFCSSSLRTTSFSSIDQTRKTHLNCIKENTCGESCFLLSFL
uniref:Glucose-6-phosphate exchanger SLC37A2 n=1 Tax=Neogobius melanostomus TaxID=47308 RepID=A0A8C6S693_9GOBI